ncbi:helix-turn-helix domain-containing protein [Frigoribacterium sp. PhB160]|uniref:helix-turn-helix domain-containing protein n=1 Tax=Frigoribacterium sp. PhB160 TaxID=2485192 RepID=UPI003519CD41
MATTVTTRQAATLLHLSTRGVRDACEKGRLEGRLIEGRWIISLASVKRYAKPT